MNWFSRIARIMFLFLAAGWLSGCSYFLARQVNRVLPPVDPSAEQAAAIKEALAGVHSLSSPDAYVGISARELNENVAPFLKQQVPGLDEIKLELRNQEVRAAVQFHGTFTLAGQPGSYSASGTIYTYPRIVDRELRYRPFADADLRLRSIQLGSNRPSDWALQFINTVLKPYINNLNGLIAQQRVPLSFQYVTALSSSDLFASLGPITVDPRDVRFETQLDSSSLLVDSDALHAVAAIGFIAQPTIAAAAAPTYEELRNAFVGISRQIDPALQPSDPLWGTTSLAASKRFIGSVINQGAEAAFPLCARVKWPDPVVNGFNEVLRTDPAPDLNCAQLHERSCAQTRPCDQNRDCNPNWGCPDCEWWQVDCHARKISCEADKVRYRTQCEAEKVAARAACEAEKEAARIGCEIEKAAQIKGCEINQAWLNEFGNMEVARVEGTGTLTDGRGSLCIQRLAASAGLDQMSLLATVNASANLAAEFKFTPLNLGHIACQAPFNGVLRSTVGAPDQPLNVVASIKPEDGTSQSSLRVNAQIADKLNLRIVPPPLLSLPLQNPQVLLFCPVAVAGATIGAGLSARVREDLIQSDFPQSLPGFSTTLQMPQQDLHLADKTLRLKSHWRPQSILWSVQ